MGVVPHDPVSAPVMATDAPDCTALTLPVKQQQLAVAHAEVTR